MTFLVAREGLDHLTPGPGRLGLMSGWFLLATWAVEWRTNPDSLVAVDRAAALREAVTNAHRAVGASTTPAERAAARVRADALREGSLAEANRIFAERYDAETRMWLALEEARAATTYAPFMTTEVLSRAEQGYVTAARLAQAHGLFTLEARRLCGAADRALKRSDFNAAAKHVAHAREAAGDDAEAFAIASHANGVLAQLTGRLPAAEAAFTAGEDAAARAGVRWLWAYHRRSRALLASELGNHAEALTLIEPLLDDPSLKGVERARTALNVGYLAFRAMSRDAIPRDIERVRSLFDAAQPVAVEPDTALHLAVNRALLEVYAGDLDAATTHLDGIVNGGAGTEVEAAIELVRGRIARTQGQLDAARAHFEAADRAAIRWWGTDGGDYGWRAQLGRGQVARDGRALASAASHLERARGRLDRLAALTDPLAHQVAFLADRDELARASLAVALERGDLEDAFTLADRSQARVMRSMLSAALGSQLTGEKQSQWVGLQADVRRAAEALRTLQYEGQVLAPAERKVWHRRERRARAEHSKAVDAAVAFLDRETRQTGSRSPAAVRRALEPGHTILVIGRGEEGRVALWANANGYHHEPLPHPAPSREHGPKPGASLDPGAGLEPLPEPPWPTTHLYVVPAGQRDVVQRAFHTALDRPWSVSLLPIAELLVAEPGRASGAPVILADPIGDLPLAREEGRGLLEEMPEATLHVHRAVTAATLTEALRSARLVHFAGHGDLVPEEPWSARLLLADGAFTVFDVLSLSAGGGLAVLNGCETGADALSAREDVLGLPEALLVARMSAVVASSVKLPEKNAARFTELFYEYGGREEPGPALQATMRRLRDDCRARPQQDPCHSTWHAWRLVGRPTLPAAPGREKNEDAR